MHTFFEYGKEHSFCGLLYEIWILIISYISQQIIKPIDILAERFDYSLLKAPQTFANIRRYVLLLLKEVLRITFNHIPHKFKHRFAGCS